jgi:hypothetical protein
MAALVSDLFFSQDTSSGNIRLARVQHVARTNPNEKHLRIGPARNDTSVHKTSETHVFDAFDAHSLTLNSVELVERAEQRAAAFVSFTTDGRRLVVCSPVTRATTSDGNT